MLASAAAPPPSNTAPQCPFCNIALDYSASQCPFGHSYCDSCSIVIPINPDEMLPNEFNNFCPQCKAISDANEEKEEAKPPNALFCPINHTLMRDPVVIQDGMSYERTSIEGWFATHKTSPLTNAPVDTRIILPNTNLRNIIELWLEGHRKTHSDFD
jgi:hypothetical protein